MQHQFIGCHPKFTFFFFLEKKKNITIHSRELHWFEKYCHCNEDCLTDDFLVLPTPQSHCPKSTLDVKYSCLDHLCNFQPDWKLRFINYKNQQFKTCSFWNIWFVHTSNIIQYLNNYPLKRKFSLVIYSCVHKHSTGNLWNVIKKWLF